MLNIISAMDIDVSNATRAIVLDDTGVEFGILFDEVNIVFLTRMIYVKGGNE